MRNSTASTVRVVAAMSVFALLFLWWCIADDSTDSAFAHTWVYDGEKGAITLNLRPNGTFHEELLRNGIQIEREGNWHHQGRAWAAELDLNFVPLAGMMDAAEESRPPGDTPVIEEYGASLDREYGVYPHLALRGQYWSPPLHRKFFR